MRAIIVALSNRRIFHLEIVGAAAGIAASHADRSDESAGKAVTKDVVRRAETHRFLVLETCGTIHLPRSNA
jgi:hypothetical protein